MDQAELEKHDCDKCRHGKAISSGEAETKNGERVTVFLCGVCSGYVSRGNSRVVLTVKLITWP